jgi:D-alanine-D-alanine ligase
VLHDPEAEGAPRRTLFAPAEDGAEVLTNRTGTDGTAVLKPLALDVAFPMLHGQNGEDGRVQGLLQTLGLPFVGAGVLASAVCMDKDVAKRLLRDAGLPIVPFRLIRWGETLSYEAAAEALGATLFVKPANSGSSVGTSKAEDAASFERAVEEAFRFDNKVLVEQAITGREIECAVIGNEEPRVAVPGEIVSTAQFYTYEAKYQNEDEARMEVPANLPAEFSDRIRGLAADAYRTLGCEGMARVDFFVTPNFDAFINEINTIPGFTARSMFPVMWEHADLPLGDLVDTLIQLALDRHERDARLQTSR